MLMKMHRWHRGGASRLVTSDLQGHSDLFVASVASVPLQKMRMTSHDETINIASTISTEPALFFHTALLYFQATASKLA